MSLLSFAEVRLCNIDTPNSNTVAARIFTCIARLNVSVDRSQQIACDVCPSNREYWGVDLKTGQTDECNFCRDEGPLIELYGGLDTEAYQLIEVKRRHWG